ncbi:hypothetical protein BsIDN1_48620 [Bacillus safensis]|uniref:Mur ligase C-terminal domain-containing protein n=1 Tax=Bacillus safensis TaxID=561879 RepID=A0A5S9MGG2_BACIA|nr:hypothetical protein BsIDN1_48620 [Bacillus safensis]
MKAFGRQFGLEGLKKVKDHPPVYLDGAHNEEGIDRLIETVQAHFSSKQVHICFSAFKR